MKHFALIALLLLPSVSIMAANEEFNAGASFGKSNSSAGTGSLKNPGEVMGAIPGYTANPPEMGYYNGVTGGDGGLASKGQSALQDSNAGQAIIDSGTKNPPTPIDPNAPFITIGKDAENSAGGILDGSASQCTATTVGKTVFEKYTCERDVWIEQSCVRNGTASGGYGQPVVTTKSITINPGDWSISNRIMSFTVPEDIVVTSGTLKMDTPAWMLDARGTFMGTPLKFSYTETFTLNVSGSFLRKGQVISSSQFCDSSCNRVTNSLLDQNMRNYAKFTLVLIAQDSYTPFVPEVKWNESCGFSTSGAVKTLSVCTVAGGDRTINFDGESRTVYSDCWQYTDQYLVKSNSKGTCEPLMNNSACTSTGTTCTTANGGYCEHETVSFDCQKTYQSDGLLCGGDYICKSGNCDETNGAGNSGFDTAVAKLAGLASAADDVAREQDQLNVKAFTGKAMSCRKAVAGFSNCCKDSGWGQDTGLAACNSDEMAIGKARAKKITVSIGERCDHQVLGVCVQKSQVYCVFDGKLARIIQEQGRRDQLGVRFGSGNNPDCRGISIPELQSINFDLINFADFYEDLMNNQRVPDTSAQVQQIKDRIAAQVNQQGGGK